MNINRYRFIFQKEKISFNLPHPEWFDKTLPNIFRSLKNSSALLLLMWHIAMAHLVLCRNLHGKFQIYVTSLQVKRWKATTYPWHNSSVQPISYQIFLRCTTSFFRYLRNAMECASAINFHGRSWAIYNYLTSGTDWPYRSIHRGHISGASKNAHKLTVHRSVLHNPVRRHDILRQNVRLLRREDVHARREERVRGAGPTVPLHLGQHHSLPDRPIFQLRWVPV